MFELAVCASCSRHCGGICFTHVYTLVESKFQCFVPRFETLLNTLYKAVRDHVFQATEFSAPQFSAASEAVQKHPDDCKALEMQFLMRAPARRCHGFDGRRLFFEKVRFRSC